MRTSEIVMRRLEREALNRAAAKNLAGCMEREASYLDDDGKSQRVRIQSEPWQLGHGMWVIKVSGRTGGVDCTRVRLGWCGRECETEVGK